MNIIVVYPGRFHPFHLGHKASYDWLVNKFGEGVYIATSNVQNDTDSPFSYADKVQMMTRLGIPASHIVQTRNPYQAQEIVDNLSTEEKNSTALVFAVSAKDAERFSFKPKRDGSPAYLQPLPDNLKQLKPMSEQGYVVVTPTVNFRVKGADANSASQIRKLYQDANDADRNNIITDLYGTPDAQLKDIFDDRLATKQEEVVRYGTPIIDGGTVDGGMREHREKLQAKINLIREQLARFRKLKLTENQIQDYIDEKNRR